MASLGLGWVGEPTVAALLEPLLAPLGMPRAAIHFTAFLVGFLVFSSLHIVLGEQVPKTFAIREPEPVSLWIAYPLHVVLHPLLPAQLAAQRRLARRSSACSASREALAPGHPDRRRDRRPRRGLRRARQDRGEARPSTSTTSSASASSSVADVMVHRTDMHSVDVDEPPDKIIDDDPGEPAHARAALGERSRRTSSASSTSRISCAR